ncbi:hypothetical protein AX774_g2194 [Zancudomyces culisetae]|uniref:Chitin-binding type-4 domain-containing protein n=1 Tax=Zancudomyces culisetae TaxID=1213189 RepID=A0A1R1PTL4_ZANCU|nr:hypothetical protein AX774_g2194 [Zancudomyces culisetae]|eukprot:OMH84284.1 hypothetical protein AX774_g2194 [Zancudomyces culisetae]
MLNSILYTLGILILAFFQLSSGHGMLDYPPPRGNVKWYGTCGAGLGCKGPCDSPKKDSKATSPYASVLKVKRGDSITVKWSRMNHPGGFVRLSMTTFNNSDSWNAFEKRVIKTVCFETNCAADDRADVKFGPLAGPGKKMCSTSIKIPGDLPNGLVTLQWMWYGGGIYYAQKDTSFGEYYSCSDLSIIGGPVDNKQQSPIFQGGDAMYPKENVCRYWGSNRPGECSFANKYPKPKPGDLLSDSLEPCTRKTPPKKGVPAMRLRF